MIAPIEPTYITPKDYWNKYHTEGDGFKTLEEVEKCAKQKPHKCQCGQFDVWKFGQCDMCFCCTTGEHDASDDLELTV